MLNDNFILSVAEAVEVPIVIGEREPSWWVWLPDIANLEEPSGIDNSSYVVVTQEEVIDGIANFVARCILEDPKSKVHYRNYYFSFWRS